MKKSCGLCVDNGAAYTLTIVTPTSWGYSTTTGPVQICWPCLQTRIGNLMHDLDPVRDPHDDGDLLSGRAGFEVVLLP